MSAPVMGISTAHRVAAALGDDGTRWRTADGRTFDDLTTGAVIVHHPSSGDLWAVEFADGSTLIVTGGAWDFGYPDCWCCASLGHTDDCTRKDGRQ